jgi:uncharacterized protein YdhG (YjbR/CyaY superfamily)
MEKTDHKTVDQYISDFPEDVQANLEKIRKTIRKVIPNAEEAVSYQMPAYKQGGYNIIYFAAFKDHYSLFIPPMGVYEAFEKELAPYTRSKATLQFQKSEPIPFDLIAKLVAYAAKQLNDSATAKEAS